MGIITLWPDADSKENMSQTMIYLDGESFSKLEKGENLKIKVAPGKHTIQLKQGLFSSANFEVNVKDFEEVHVVIGTNYKAKSTLNTALIPIVFFGGFLYNAYYLKSELFFWAIMISTALFLIIESYKVKFKGMLYYLTIGRKDYFHFELKKRR